MKKVLFCLAAAAVLAVVATATTAQNGKPVQLVRFSSMHGVEGPFIGLTNPMHGMEGDDLPWDIKRGSGALLPNGKLNVKVRGLVYADDPNVPANLVGTNNEANFRAAVSCTTFDATGAVSEAMIITPAFPATETGNANIMTTVTLPDPCLAPMVMILAGADDHWLAVMGSGEPEEPGP